MPAPKHVEEMNRARRNEQLLRRARLRRLLTEHTGEDGFATNRAIAKHFKVDATTIEADLRAIGAVKLHDDIKKVSWWTVPAHNPNLPDYREVFDEGVMLNELSLKMRAHVLEIVPFGNLLIFKTERSAGPLLADWLSLLTWEEIVHVSEERHAAVMHCVSEEAVDWVMARLIGDDEEAS